MTIRGFTIAISLTLVTTSAFATPNLINYQGVLTDIAGNPLDGSVEMTFALYDAASGGSPLWDETEAVFVTRGLYNAVLGDDVVVSLPFDQPYFLGVTITGESEMTPRQPLTTVGTALKAGIADGTSDAVTASKIQDGSITLNKLPANCNVGEILVMAASGWECGPSPH